MSAKTYGVGIVGLGVIAEFHARALAELPNARLVAGYDVVQPKGLAFAEKFSCDYMSDFQAFCTRRDIDVISVCTPSGAHADSVIPAVQAHKHVICEKPLDITLARIDSMIAAAAKAQVKLGGIFPFRFDAAVGQIKQAVDAGRFGRLTCLAGSVPWWRTDEYYDTGGWRGTWAMDGGGALMNQAIHVVDLLQFLGGPVKRVQAVTARLAHPQIEVEDTIVALLEYQNGALGTMTAATSMYPGRFRRLEISGSAGSAVMVENDLESWQFADDSPQDADIRRRFSRATDTGGGAADPKAIGHQGHCRNYESFFQALDSGIDPILDGRQARMAVELILAIYRSAKLARPVDLPLLDVDNA